MKIVILIIAFILMPIDAVAMQVAITVDDLPAHGELPSHLTRMNVAKKMLSVFKKHHIIGVYGFINGNKLNKTQKGLSILKAWVNAGHYLGNHTYDHLDLAKTDSYNYITNIKKNESLLLHYMGNKPFYFRYPFLAEGDTQNKRDTIRQYLFINGYKIAPVTVDFFEYEWSDPYIRCLKKHDKPSIAWLKKSYLQQADNALTISHELSMMLMGKDIKNILIIHINAMSAAMLDDLLTLYEKRQVTFITLDEALNDTVYEINPNIVRDRTYTFLNQLRLARGLNNPDKVNKLYHSLPEVKLNRICR